MAGELLNATLVGDMELLAHFTSAPAEMMRVVDARVTRYTIALQAKVLGKLHGEVLHQRSGNLAASIQQRRESGALYSYGYVFSSGDVKYAGIHEYGGIIKHPGGTAYFTQYGGGVGNTVWLRNDSPLAAHAPRTRPHDIPMPKRSYLRSSLSDMASEIRNGLIQAATQGMAAAIQTGKGGA